MFETRKKNAGFHVLRQGVPEGRSSEEQQMKSWPWHVEVIPGVSLVGLVTNEDLCKVVWGIIIKNFMHKYSFIFYFTLFYFFNGQCMTLTL